MSEQIGTRISLITFRIFRQTGWPSSEFSETDYEWITLMDKRHIKQVRRTFEFRIINFSS